MANAPDTLPPTMVQPDAATSEEVTTPKTAKKSDEAKPQTGKKTFALTEENVFRKYRDADEYTLVLNQPFDEFQRIARKKPHPDLSPKFPRIAEGSTSAFIKQKPRQLIQQTPTGKVGAHGDEVLSLIGQWAFDYEIVPNATEDYPVFEKAQTAMEQALTVGFSVTTAPYYKHENGVFAPDMSFQFWGDVVVPSGYKSIRSMPYLFLKGWWPKSTVDAIINDPASAKGGWNVPKLKEMADNLTAKNDRSMTPAEKSRGLPSEYIEVVVAHQEGVNAPVFTFDPSGEQILRLQTNPDPRGKKNVQVLYGAIDGTNPFGYSIVEMVGDWQNLMDTDVQAYQYNRMYNLDPATVRHGNIGDGELHPGASFDATTEQDAIDLIELTTSALDQFPDLYDWQRSVLVNLLTSPPSSGDGDNPLGKTPKGISQAAMLVSTDDLTFTNHIHEWFKDWGEGGLNIYFAKRKGIQQLHLDETTAAQLRDLIENGKFKPIALTDDNILTFNFDQKFPIFTLDVDGGSSKVQDETSQLTALQNLKEIVDADPELSQMAGSILKAKIYNKMVAVSGIHDGDELALNIQNIEEQQKQEEDEAGAKAKADEAKPPTFAIAFKDLSTMPQPAAAKAQIEALKFYGIDTLTPQDFAAAAPSALGALPGQSAPMQPGATTPPQHHAEQSPVSAPVQSVTPPANTLPTGAPTPPEPIVNAALKLQRHGVPAVAVPHAMEALTDGVPLEDIKSAFAPQGATNGR